MIKKFNNKKNKTLKKKIIYLTLILFLIGLGYRIFRLVKIAKENDENFPIPVHIVFPTIGTINEKISLTGTIEAAKMVTVLPKVAGSLKETYAEVGEYVKKNQVIAEIDKESFLLQYNQAKAAYDGIISSYKRTKKLFEQKVISKQQYDEVSAKHDAYKAQYELAKLQLNYTDIKAPISGYILIKHTEAGSLVANSIPLYTIGEISKVKLKAEIPEIYFGRINEAKDNVFALIRPVAYSEMVFKGNIKNISPYISPQSRAFSVEIEINNSNQLLKPGMFCYTDIVVKEHTNTLLIPAGIISSSNTLNIAVSNRLKIVKVEKGIENNEKTEILSGIATNTFVISEIIDQVKPGSLLNIVNRDAALNIHNLKTAEADKNKTKKKTPKNNTENKNEKKYY